jgi:hypothetical protein
VGFESELLQNQPSCGPRREYTARDMTGSNVNG